MKLAADRLADRDQADDLTRSVAMDDKPSPFGVPHGLAVMSCCVAETRMCRVQELTRMSGRQKPGRCPRLGTKAT